LQVLELHRGKIKRAGTSLWQMGNGFWCFPPP